MKYLHKNETSLRVRYGETDQMGYCYYGNYAQFCEVGRVEALREIGMSYRKMEEEGIMLPVSEYKIQYKIPAKYDDLLMIRTIVEKVDGARIYFTYEILNEAKKVVAIAETTLVFVAKKTMRPTAPPKSFLQILSRNNEK